MAKKKAKPKKAKQVRLERKYVVRRFMLLLFMAAFVGVGCWYVLGSGLFGEKTTLFTPELIISARFPTQPSQKSVAALDLEDDALPVSSADTGRWNLILVNAESPLPDNFEVDLKTLTYLENRPVQVDSRIYGFTLEMFNQARLSGIDIYPRSAYRSIDYQKELHDNKTAEYMAGGMTREAASAEAATIVQIPGNSEHHTGLAIDISTSTYTRLDEGFAGTPAFKWLDENAHKYGFVLRYPENKQHITGIIYEPWHYRYVGVKHAAIIKQNNYCLEEYVYALVTGQLEQQPEDGEENEGSEQQAAD